MVVIVVFDGVKLLDAAGPAEVFAEANRFGADYQIKIASVDGRDVTTSIGTYFPVTERISSIEKLTRSLSPVATVSSGGQSTPPWSTR